MSGRFALRAAVPVLLLLTFVSATAHADYKSDYGKGMRAVDKKDWETVAASMRTAIAQNPTPSTKKIKLYGNRYTPYLPYFNLGLALYQMGDCAGALQAWQQSENQGAIQASGDYQDLVRYRDECKAKAPPPTAPPTVRPTRAPPTRVPATPTPSGPSPAELLAAAKRRAASAISAAGAAEQELLSRRESRDFAPVWDDQPQLLNRVQQAADTLEQARTKSRSDKLDQVQEAEGLAERAQQSYSSLAAAVDRRQQELASIVAEEARAAAAARARLVGEINGLVPAAREALGSGDSISRSGQRSLRSQRSQLEELVTAAGRAGDGSLSQAQLEALRDDLGAATSSYRNGVNRVLAEESKPIPPTPTPVPTPTPLPTPVVEPSPTVDPLERLRIASDAFLSGEYAVALTTLQGVTGEDRVAAVSHLVRAACSYYLYTAGGSQDASLRSTAEADVRLCRGADSAVVPDDRYFSPAFVSFFNQLGG